MIPDYCQFMRNGRFLMYSLKISIICHFFCYLNDTFSAWWHCLLLFAILFVLIIFANLKLLHSEILNEIIIVYVCLTIVTFAIIGYVFFKYMTKI